MGMRRNRTIYHLTMTAAVAAALCLLSPWAVPLGPVPVSLCTFLLYLSAWLLRPGQVAAAAGVYVLLGAAGLPVFSGFLGGLGRLAGPTGGYIAGYLPLAVLCALFVRVFPTRRWLHLLGMILGTAVLYGTGTVWFCLQTQTSPTQALVLCVLPFVPGDLAKMTAALFLGPVLKDRLERSGLLYQ